MIIAAVIIIVLGGALLYEEPSVVIYSGPIIQANRTGLGIFGAVFGALLGGILWAVIGSLGYISGWIGILIMIFSYKGYEIMAHRRDKFGLIISTVLSIAVIFPATYLSYGWYYYCAVNESVSGYTTLTRALVELAPYMEKIGAWPDYAKDVGMGLIFMLVSGFYFLTGQNRNR